MRFEEAIGMARRMGPSLCECACGHQSAFCEGPGRQPAWLGVWFLPRLSATVVTSRISVRARCVTWKRTAVADTNGCTCWIQRPRNTLSSSRKEWQLRLFVRSRVGAKSRAGCPYQKLHLPTISEVSRTPCPLRSGSNLARDIGKGLFRYNRTRVTVGSRNSDTLIPETLARSAPRMAPFLDPTTRLQSTSYLDNI